MPSGYTFDEHAGTACWVADDLPVRAFVCAAAAGAQRCSRGRLLGLQRIEIGTQLRLKVMSTRVMDQKLVRVGAAILRSLSSR